MRRSFMECLQDADKEDKQEDKQEDKDEDKERLLIPQVKLTTQVVSKILEE